MNAVAVDRLGRSHFTRHERLVVGAEDTGGKDVDVAYTSPLFRFARDLAMSSFGMRQDIYEYWHAGDPSRNGITLLSAYDHLDIIAMVKDMCKPLAHGEVP